MAKMMLFIDGSWLYANTPRLADAYGNAEFHIDFGKLPAVLAAEVGKALGTKDVDIVRTYLFGSYGSNYDLKDDDAVQRRREFFSMLKEEFHYEVETFPVNYRGRRIRFSDRNPSDTFQPKEKCVDISLATSMLYFAAIPYAYDIAIAVIGDQDFKPVLQHVRRLGKRVALASIKGSCAPEYADPRDEARVKDFDIIWIDDLLHDLELRYERHQLTCQSPIHKGKPEVWTTFRPRRGQTFFCDNCRGEFQKQKHQAFSEMVEPQGEPQQLQSMFTSQDGNTTGVISNIIRAKGFGFIKVADGTSYYFNVMDLATGLTLDQLSDGVEVEFEIKRPPAGGKAGAAQNLRKTK